MIKHVIMKLKEQETYYEGKTYPHYEIGWKEGDTFNIWNGLKVTEKDLDSWKELE